MHKSPFSHLVTCWNQHPHPNPSVPFGLVLVRSQLHFNPLHTLRLRGRMWGLVEEEEEEGHWYCWRAGSSHFSLFLSKTVKYLFWVFYIFVCVCVCLVYVLQPCIRPWTHWVTAQAQQLPMTWTSSSSKASWRAQWWWDPYFKKPLKYLGSVFVRVSFKIYFQYSLIEQ